jgi:t-SNARE complex subunit (syntaxin)
MAMPCVQEYITAISQATARILELTAQAMIATSIERETELGKQIAAIASEGNKAAVHAKKLVQELRCAQQADSTEAGRRMQLNFCNSLVSKLMDTLRAFQSAQQKYTADTNKKVGRQLRILQPQLTDGVYMFLAVTF